MSVIQNRPKPGSDSNQRKHIGNIGRAFAESTVYQNPIEQANSVPINLIFKKYNISFNGSTKINCPLPDHQGDRTPSFMFYKRSNTFYCFGCQSGSKPCHFVSKMENISVESAAEKILNEFTASSDFCSEHYENQEERLKILNDFSNSVFLFRKTFLNENAFNYIENMCEVYDDIAFSKNKTITNECLASLTNILKEKINNDSKKYLL